MKKHYSSWVVSLSPYIKNRGLINKNNIPLLVPWAAGGPITRYPQSDNWVFRLSIDDSKAGIRISELHLINSPVKILIYY